MYGCCSGGVTRLESVLCRSSPSRKWACMETGPRWGATAAGGAKCCCSALPLPTLSLLLLSGRGSAAVEASVCVVWWVMVVVTWGCWEGGQSGSSPPQVPAVLPLLDENGEEMERRAWERWLVGDCGCSGGGSLTC